MEQHSTRWPGASLLVVGLLAACVAMIAPEPGIAQTPALPAFLVAADEQMTGEQASDDKQPVKVQALWRSMFLPGWGQMYKGETKRGLFFLSGVVSMIGLAQFSDIARSDAVDNYNVARRNYDLAIDQAEIDTYWSEMESEWDSISRFKNLRNFGIVAAVGVYVWNVIDASRGFPMSKKGVDVGITQTVDGAPAVALRITR